MPHYFVPGRDGKWINLDLIACLSPMRDGRGRIVSYLCLTVAGQSVGEIPPDLDTLGYHIIPRAEEMVDGAA